MLGVNGAFIPPMLKMYLGLMACPTCSPTAEPRLATTISINRGTRFVTRLDCRSLGYTTCATSMLPFLLIVDVHSTKFSRSWATQTPPWRNAMPTSPPDRSTKRLHSGCRLKSWDNKKGAVSLQPLILYGSACWARTSDPMIFVIGSLYRYLHQTGTKKGLSFDNPSVFGSACWARTSDPMINSHSKLPFNGFQIHP